MFTARWMCVRLSKDKIDINTYCCYQYILIWIRIQKKHRKTTKSISFSLFLPKNRMRIAKLPVTKKKKLFKAKMDALQSDLQFHEAEAQEKAKAYTQVDQEPKSEAPDRIKQLDIVQLEARQLFEKKNKDYGDAFATYGPVGVLVRIGDKIQRLQSIHKRGITLIEDEKMRDTLIDLHNYAAMAIMLIDEK